MNYMEIVNLDKSISQLFNDSFMQETIKRYFNEYCKEKSDEQKVQFLRDLALDRDVLNEFTQYLEHKTYAIKDAINVAGMTAQSISQSNPEKLAIEVYIDLANYKNEKELERVKNSVEKSNFVYNHSRGSLLPKNRLFNDIIVTDNLIYKKKDGKVSIIEDTLLAKKVYDTLLPKIDDFKKYCELEKSMDHARNNFKDMITIKFDNNWYSINKSVANDEIVDFFNKFIADVLLIIHP